MRLSEAQVKRLKTELEEQSLDSIQFDWVESAHASAGEWLPTIDGHELSVDVMYEAEADRLLLVVYDPADEEAEEPVVTYRVRVVLEQV